MKKFLAIALVLMLAVGCFCLTGCGDATFDGNYQEATTEEIQTIVNSADFQQGTHEIDESNGYEMIMDMYMLDGDNLIDVDMNLKFAMVEDDAQMQGSINGKVKADLGTPVDMEARGNFYYADGWTYADETGKISGTQITQKVKKQVEWDTYYAPYLSLMSMAEYYDLSLLVEMLEEDDNVSVSIATDNSGTKIKFVVTADEEGSEGSVEAIFVYDADYKLTATKINIDARYTDDDGTTTTKILMTYKPWTGTINLPADLADYELKLF